MPYQKIKYEKSFVAFLDVLGFKQMVYSKNNQLIQKYFNIVNDAIQYLKDIPSKREIGSIVISDSIILSIPCGENNIESLDKLRHLCIAIGLIQQNLAVAGIWLRGAITCGDTYFNPNENQIVGPAYINAYLLEESLAIYPRVFLDSKLIPELNFKNASDLIGVINKSGNVGLDYSNWGSRILFEWTHPNGDKIKEIPQDVPLFIDYISPLIEENNKTSLKLILQHIQTNMYLDSRIYSKYRWVADYFKVLAKRARLNDCELDIELDYFLGDL